MKTVLVHNNVNIDWVIIFEANNEPFLMYKVVKITVGYETYNKEKIS